LLDVDATEAPSTLTVVVLGNGKGVMSKHPTHCIECGQKRLRQPKRGGGPATLLLACGKKRSRASINKWRVENIGIHRAVNASWYKRARKGNPAWEEENKRRAKTRRKRNRAGVIECDQTRRP
jgi:hypothetical protein